MCSAASRNHYHYSTATGPTLLMWDVLAGDSMVGREPGVVKQRPPSTSASTRSPKPPLPSLSYVHLEGVGLRGKDKGHIAESRI